MAQWGPELMEKEHLAKQTAQILFFVVDKQTRSVATVIEAAYYTAAQKTFILVIDPYQGPGQIIQGEPISQQYIYHTIITITQIATKPVVFKVILTTSIELNASSLAEKKSEWFDCVRASSIGR